MLPQANARLLTIARGGSTEDYDRTADSPPVVWTGNMDAYVQQKIVSAFNDQGELRRTLRVTLIFTEDVSQILQAGDTVTVAVGTPSAPSILSARIQNIANPANLPQIPGYYVCSLEEVEAQ